jgi:hypothetical protein
VALERVHQLDRARDGRPRRPSSARHRQRRWPRSVKRRAVACVSDWHSDYRERERTYDPNQRLAGQRSLPSSARPPAAVGVGTTMNRGRNERIRIR